MEQTITGILSDLEPLSPDRPKPLKDGAPITIWLPAEAKERYDALQLRSGRQFSKKLRAILMETITQAEKRIQDQ